MVPWRRILAVVGGIAAVAVLATELYWPYNKELGQFFWDYLVDPVALIVIGINILVNIGDSLRIRGGSGNVPGPMAQGRCHGAGGDSVGAFPNAVQRQDSPRPRSYLRVVGPPDGPGRCHTSLRSHLNVAVLRTEKPRPFRLKDLPIR